MNNEQPNTWTEFLAELSTTRSMIVVEVMLEQELKAINELNTDAHPWPYRKAVVEDLLLAHRLTLDLDVIHYKLAKVMGDANKVQELHDWLFHKKAKHKSEEFMDRVRQAIKEQ